MLWAYHVRKKRVTEKGKPTIHALGPFAKILSKGGMKCLARKLCIQRKSQADAKTRARETTISAPDIVNAFQANVGKRSKTNSVEERNAPIRPVSHPASHDPDLRTIPRSAFQRSMVIDQFPKNIIAAIQSNQIAAQSEKT
jgi:hypothetical protein